MIEIPRSHFPLNLELFDSSVGAMKALLTESPDKRTSLDIEIDESLPGTAPVGDHRQ
jgi:hypothetical protein